LLATVALVARARQDFSKPTCEGESFRRYIQSRFPPRLSVEYRGKQWPIADVFYKWFRCEVVHAGGLPVDIAFMDDIEPGSLSVRAGGAPNYLLLISPRCLDQLPSWARA
jgi:hypothetical protein